MKEILLVILRPVTQEPYKHFLSQTGYYSFEQQYHQQNINLKNI